MDMAQEEPSTNELVDVNVKDMQLCSSFTSRQRPIVSVLQKRERTGSIDVDYQDPPAHKLKRYEAAAGIITPQFELRPTLNSDAMSLALPFFDSIKGVQSPCPPTEDIKKIAAYAGKDAVSSMDDEPVWDNMCSIEEPSAFVSSLQQPAFNTRKVTADFDANTKQDDLSGGIFGWFTDDVDQYVTLSKPPTDASLVSGSSSDSLTNDEEAKQPFLLPSVSLEVEDSSSVINSRQLLNGMGGDIDADMNLDEPVFEDVIIDPATLDPATLNPSASLEDMFNFDDPTSPMQTTCSLLDGDEMGFSSTTHLKTINPLPYSKPESATPAVQEPSTNLITPESLKQDTSEIMAIDLLADVADAASMELMEDQLAAPYIFDSSSSSENEMTTPHQSSKKEKKNRSVSAWRKQFDKLREFSRENGHCNIPQKYAANPSLGRWVARQRFFMRQYLDAQGEANAALPSSQMDIDEKMKLLRTIGLQASPNKKGTRSSVSVFISCRNTKEWDNRFAELLRYKSIHGNCDVPVKSDGDFKSLGRWVTSQRKKYKDFHSGQLGGDNTEQFLTRFRRLEEIGFKFKIGSGRGSGRLASKSSGERKPKPSKVLP